VRDISALSAVPHLLLAEPAAEPEVHALLDYLVNQTSHSAYLRLVSVKWPLPFAYPSNIRVQPGRGWTVRPGTDAVVFGYGPWMLSNAWHAAEQLEQNGGASLSIVNLPWLNRVDAGWLQQTIGARRTVITLDNHYVQGGQGEMLAAAVAELGLHPGVRVSRIGVGELPKCGTNDEVLAYHRLDVAGLLEQFRVAIEQSARRTTTEGPVTQIA
jgi:transketolase